MPAVPSPVLFLHIPRTAGFTLKTILSAHFGTDRTLLDVHRYDVGPTDLEGKAVIEGHIGAAFFRSHFGADWPSLGVTIIRDPVERVVSQARHLRSLPRIPFHEPLAAAVADPGAVFEQVPPLSNLQTRLLTGRAVQAKPQLDEADLAEARATLERMAVCTTESFDLSMALLVARLGITLPRYRKMNASPATGDEDLRGAEFRAAAEQHNHLDRSLHTFASALLTERARRLTGDALAGADDSCTPEYRLSFAGVKAEGGVVVPAPARQVEVAGWVALGGRPADTVVLRAAGQATPLATRVQSSEAAGHFKSAACLWAGVRGRVPLPAEADHVEIVAVDRARGLRGEIHLPVTRTPAETHSPD